MGYSGGNILRYCNDIFSLYANVMSTMPEGIGKNMARDKSCPDCGSFELGARNIRCLGCGKVKPDPGPGRYRCQACKTEFIIDR